MHASILYYQSAKPGKPSSGCRIDKSAIRALALDMLFPRYLSGFLDLSPEAHRDQRQRKITALCGEVSCVLEPKSQTLVAICLQTQLPVFCVAVINWLGEAGAAFTYCFSSKQRLWKRSAQPDGNDTRKATENFEKNVHLAWNREG